MRGIEYVVDQKGRKKAVLIDLGRHSEVWEDAYDALLERKRRAEPRESLVQVKAQLERRQAAAKRG